MWTVRRAELGVLALAVVVRLAYLVAEQPLRYGVGYDQSVYYATAVAMLHGRLPYADFTLLHPPGLPLLQLPWALLGHFAGDRTGYAVATLVGLLVGALGSVVVLRIARAAGWSTGAAVAAGLVQALTFPAVVAGSSARLEPYADLAALLGILVLLGAGRARTRGLLGGALLALAVSVKATYLVPAVVVVGWMLLSRRLRARAVPALAGAVLTAAVVDLPFLLLSRGAMWSMVVTAQLGRNRSPLTPLERLGSQLGLHLLWGPERPAPPAWLPVASWLLVLVTLAAVVLATRAPLGALFAALFVVESVLLLVTPSWFAYYAELPVPALALCVGAAWQAAGRVRRGRLPAALVAAGSPVLAGAVLVVHAVVAAQPPHVGVLPAQTRRLLAPYSCVVAESPESQVLLGRLDTDLGHGCPDWVDVSGSTYWRVPPADPAARGRRWNQLLLRYYRSGDAAVLVRQRPGTSGWVRRQLDAQGRVLVRQGSTLVVTTPHASPR